MIMINMKRFCIISALFLAMLCGAAQEFLTPTSYGLYGTSNIFEILLTGNSPNKLYHKKTPMEGLYLKTFYISAPSFSPEYALIIEKDRLVLNWVFLVCERANGGVRFQKVGERHPKTVD